MSVQLRLIWVVPNGTAVKLLGQMQERQAAKVLAELPEPDLAATLLEKLRGLKRPTPTVKPP